MTRPDWLWEVNPFGKVPVLLYKVTVAKINEKSRLWDPLQGKVIYESLVTCEWVEEVLPGKPHIIIAIIIIIIMFIMLIIIIMVIKIMFRPTSALIRPNGSSPRPDAGRALQQGENIVIVLTEALLFLHICFQKPLDSILGLLLFGILICSVVSGDLISDIRWSQYQSGDRAPDENLVWLEDRSGAGPSGKGDCCGIGGMVIYEERVFL